MTDALTPIPTVPLSWGEVIDKITILEIKVDRLIDAQAQAHTARELSLLREIAAPALARGELAALVRTLKALNQDLWDIEDRIRDHERTQAFDSAFIALARSIYRKNDERSRVKRQINQALGSGLIEEKSYQPY